MTTWKQANDGIVLKKVDATDGSLSHTLAEIEGHIHRYTRGMGIAASASGETHVADRVGPSINPFTLTSGNDAYGSWTQILGSSDTPIHAGLLYDAAEVLITAVNDNAMYVVQISWGESTALAGNLTSGEYTEFPVKRDSASIQSSKETIPMKPLPVGTKLWARTLCIGQNAKTLSFYFGVHEYKA